ncbi:hypothetical protein ASF74_03435 [Arthrobacter sp. Leaf145]|nr:hypothetical protein ASF74_03435 [Arthrobacter sp. Leaf145]
MLAAMVISVEGAKLLAALIPVLVLVLAVERRAMGPEPLPFRRSGLVWFVAKGIAQFSGIGGSVFGLIPLFIAVNSNRDVDGVWSVVVIVCTVVLIAAVASVTMDLAVRGYIGSDVLDHGLEAERVKRINAHRTKRLRRARKIALRRQAARGRGE